MAQEQTKNPIYDYLKSEGVTDLSEADFIAKYTDRTKLKEVYDWLKFNENTDLEFEPFADKYFPLPKSNDVSTQGSESTSVISSEPLVTSQDGNPELEAYIKDSKNWTNLPDGFRVLNVTPEAENQFGGLGLIANNITGKDWAVRGSDGTINMMDINSNRDLTELEASVQREELTPWESVKNSVKNMGTQLRGFDDRLTVATQSIYSALFGEETARKIYDFLEVRPDSKGYLGNREEALNNLQQLGAETLPTLGIIESGREGDLAGISAGVVNGASAVVSTLITGALTFGGGIASDMLGGTVYDYNAQKAETEGLTTQELFNQGKADLGVPLTIGAIATSLELFGISGVARGVTSKLTGSIAKKATILGLEMNKEGMTEYVQFGLDAYSNAKAKGLSDSEAGSALISALGSEQGIEMYLQGMAGSASAIGGGRLAKGILSSKTKSEITKKGDEIIEIGKDIANIQDPVLKSALLDKASNLAEEITTLKNQESVITEQMSPEQLDRVTQISNEMDSIDTTLANAENSENEATLISDSTKSTLEQRKKDLASELDNILKDVNTEESSAVPVESSQVERVGTETTTEEELVVGNPDQATDSVQQNEPFTETEQAELVNTVTNIQGVEDAPTFVESIKNSLSDSNIRQSRIQELEAKFQQRREQGGNNLGIAQDPRQEAQYWADVTEYAILKIADGTIKTVQSLAKVLGIEETPELQKAFTDAQAVNDIVSKATVTPKKQTVKSTIKQATEGKIQGKVELTNREALTQRIRALNEGAKLGKKAIEESRSEITQLVNDLNESQAFKGKVNMTALRRAIKNVNNANTAKQVERATQVIERIVDDAGFANKLANVDVYRERMKRIAKSKSTPKDLANVLSNFSKVSTRDLEIQELDEYLTLAESIYKRQQQVSTVNNEQLQKIIDISNANKQLRQEELEAKKSTPEAKQVKLQSLRDKLVDQLGVDQKVVDSIDDGSRPIDEVIAELQEMFDNLKTTREDKVREVGSEYLSEIKSSSKEILDAQVNPSEKTIIQEFLDLDVKESDISKSSLGGFITTMYNLLNNNSSVNLGKIITEVKRNRALEDKTTVNLVKGFLNTPTAVLRKLNAWGATSGSQLFDAIVKKREDIGKLHTFTGFIDVQIQSNKAFQRIEQLKKEFSDIVKKHSKDLNQNPVGEVLMTIYADVSQYRQTWTAEQIANEYNLRLQAWGESLDRRKKKAESNSEYEKVNRNVIKNLEKALSQITEVTEVDGKNVYSAKVSQQELYDMLSEGHKELHRFMRGKFDELKNDHFAVSRAYGGLDVETDWVNYTPRTYASIPSSGEQAINRQLASTAGRVQDVDSGMSFNQSLTKENTGTGKSRLISGDKLPLNRVLNTQLLEVFLNEASAIIYDSETMPQRQYTSSMLDVERTGLEFDDQVPIILYKEKVAQKILGDKFSLGTGDLNPSVIKSSWAKLGRMGTALALGGTTQFIKQTTPLAEVLGRVSNPKRFFTAIQYLNDPQVAEILKQGDISLRSIENEIETPRSSNIISREESNDFIRTLRRFGIGADKITDSAVSLSLSPLKITDSFIARVGWLAFYIDNTANRNNGVIDFSKVDKEALAYANTQNSIVMNESDSSLQGSLSKKPWMRMMFPFSSFSINAKMTLVNSIGRLSRARTATDIKRFSGEVIGNLTNIAVFNAIGFGIRALAISSGAYFIQTAINNATGVEDEDKEKMLEELDKDLDNRQALNNIRSLGYLTQDFMFGGLFGKFLEPAFESATDYLIRANYGDDELRARGWGNVKGMMQKSWYENLFSIMGTQGIYGQKIVDISKMGADVAESKSDYVMRRFGGVNAMRDDVVVDSYYLDENNIDKYSKPEWERASTMTSLLLSAGTLSGLSDQYLNSTLRYAGNVSRAMLQKEHGLVSKQDKEKMIESAKKTTAIKIGDINIQLDYEQKMWYYNEWITTVNEAKKSFPRPSAMPETLYEKTLTGIVEANMVGKYLTKYKDNFDKNVNQTVRDAKKKAQDEADKIKYYNK